jgi:hypothetical protein
MRSDERRSAVRLAVKPGIKVEIVGRGRPLRLINVGAGGFSIASDDMLAALARPEFRFSSPDQSWSTTIVAQMAYCLLRPRAAGSHEGKYVTGYTFCDGHTPEMRDRIRDFLGQVTVDPVSG